MKHISTPAFKEVLEAERSNPSVDFINVCTSAEYKERHIEGVRNVPLDEIDQHLNEFSGKKTIFVHCRSGRRGERAIEKLRTLGISAELVNVEGGLLAWEEAGYATGSYTSRLPIMRQVFIVAGLLVLVGHALFFFFGAPYLTVSVITGAGLLVSGLTGWCTMATLLAKMPWNR